MTVFFYKLTAQTILNQSYSRWSWTPAKACTVASTFFTTPIYWKGRCDRASVCITVGNAESNVDFGMWFSVAVISSQQSLHFGLHYKCRVEVQMPGQHYTSDSRQNKVTGKWIEKTSAGTDVMSFRPGQAYVHRILCIDDNCFAFFVQYSNWIISLISSVTSARF